MSNYSDMLIKAIKDQSIRTKENNVGWVVYINIEDHKGLFEGYRGRTVWATKGAATRAVKMMLYTDYMKHCHQNNVYCSYWNDHNFNRQYKEFVKNGLIKIVEVKL